MMDGQVHSAAVNSNLGMGCNKMATWEGPPKNSYGDYK